MQQGLHPLSCSKPCRRCQSCCQTSKVSRHACCKMHQLIFAPVQAFAVQYNTDLVACSCYILIIWLLLRYRRPLQPASLRRRFSHSATATQPQLAACSLACAVCSPHCAGVWQAVKQQAAASRSGHAVLAAGCCWLDM
jgi:hypothetical protein